MVKRCHDIYLWLETLMDSLWEPSDFFRLAICHARSNARLASELAKQLPEFGFACRQLAADASGDWSQVDATLNTMDGCIALLTREFFDEPLCNQIVGVAIGRGVHVHAVEVSCQPVGLLHRIPAIAVPTDSALPRLIAQFVARDPLSSRRLSTGAVRALAKCPTEIEQRIPSLEALRFPSSDAVVELRKLRHAVRENLRFDTVLKLDRIIERWQDQVLSDAL
jgi:hypothetical protein